MESKQENIKKIISEKCQFDLHLKYLFNLDKTKDVEAIGYYTNEYLKMAETHNKEETIKFVQKCQTETGGFGGSIGHDSHITSTHYALLILSQLDSLNSNTEHINFENIAIYVKNLQEEDGSFKCDDLGEIDTRFSYCAVSILKLLNKLNKNYINLDKATEYVLSCQNFDGGFGGIPGAESHAAYAFCCVGFLAVTDQLNLIDSELTGQWLAARQTHSGGFNGRPEKLQDVCYSWWVLSSMYMINKSNYIDLNLLQKFILECQDEDGGIADRPGNTPDVFHTFFGLAGLSLMGYERLKKINAIYAIPEEDLKKVLK